MKKTIVICDKCGRELLPGEEVVRMDLDLCEECENDLLNIVQLWVDGEFFSVNVPEEQPKSYFEIEQEKKKRQLQLVEESCEKVVNQIMEAEKPKTSGKKGKIDWDKAIRMKQEGYKHSEIAEAVGTTHGTIDNAIYREMNKRGIKHGKN